MNIYVLEKFIKSKSNYFIALHKSRDNFGKEYQRIYLISCPSELCRLRPKGKLNDDNEYLIDDKDISLDLLKTVNEMYIEINIPLSDNFTPFQSGIKTSWFDEIHEVDEYINKFLLEVFKLRGDEPYLKDYKFSNYITLYNTICKNKKRKKGKIHK